MPGRIRGRIDYSTGKLPRFQLPEREPDEDTKSIFASLLPNQALPARAEKPADAVVEPGEVPPVKMLAAGKSKVPVFGQIHKDYTRAQWGVRSVAQLALDMGCSSVDVLGLAKRLSLSTDLPPIPTAVNRG